MVDQYPQDPGDLRRIGPETLTLPAGTVLWRIHFTAGPYVTPWNRVRTWGPVPGSRWDPHPLPEGDCAPLGAAYLGEDVLTCLAEVFQETRFVDVDRGAPYVTAFATARDTVLADLTGLWLTRAGASAHVTLQQKERTRAWARAIHTAWPNLDGVVAPSAVAGGRRVIAFWNNGPMPGSPEFTAALNSPAILKDIVAAAGRVGYTTNAIA